MNKDEKELVRAVVRVETPRRLTARELEVLATELLGGAAEYAAWARSGGFEPGEDAEVEAISALESARDDADVLLAAAAACRAHPDFDRSDEFHFVLYDLGDLKLVRDIEWLLSKWRLAVLLDEYEEEDR